MIFYLIIPIIILINYINYIIIIYSFKRSTEFGIYFIAQKLLCIVCPIVAVNDSTIE